MMCISPVHIRDTPENWVTLQNGPNHHPKYHLQLKSTDAGVGAGEVSYGKLARKAQ